MVIFPSSIGWRSTSIATRENSGNSSRKSTPLWASDISPGLGIAPPPERPAGETVWCGERKGRAVSSPVSGTQPATECMRVTSSAS